MIHNMLPSLLATTVSELARIHRRRVAVESLATAGVLARQSYVGVVQALRCSGKQGGYRRTIRCKSAFGKCADATRATRMCAPTTSLRQTAGAPDTEFLPTDSSATRMG